MAEEALNSQKGYTLANISVISLEVWAINLERNAGGGE